ncbi:hypothetical protein [Pulveribacter suum]|uniref:hypothetical protein n=1 Tax=Pulveribacter suum TaxID=2116657 RepID=UPI00386E2ECE
MPFVLALALRRLIGIAWQLAHGRLRFASSRRALWVPAAALAYAGLLGYSLALFAALGHALFLATDRLPACLALAGYALAYPLVYFAAAWVFYYAFQRETPHPGPPT